MKNETWSSIFRLLRFGVVGTLNTAISYGVFSLFLFLGLHYSLATLGGGLVGMTLGFKLHGALVFKHSGKGRFVWFALVFVLIYMLSLGIQLLARRGVNGYLAGAIASAITVPISFSLNQVLVFRDTNKFT